MDSHQPELMQVVDSVIGIILSEKALCAFVRDSLRSKKWTPEQAIEEAFATFQLESILSLLKSQKPLPICSRNENDDAVPLLKPMYSTTEPIQSSNSKRDKWTKSDGSIRISQTLKAEFATLLKKNNKEFALAKLYPSQYTIPYDISHQEYEDNLLDPTRRRVRFPSDKSIVSEVHIIRDPFTREEAATLFYSFIDGMRFTYEHADETSRAVAAGVSWNQWMLARTVEDVALDEEAAAAQGSHLDNEKLWYEVDNPDYEADIDEQF